MSTHLPLADAQTAADALTFATRAARVGDGTVRLRAVSGVLAMSCAPVAPRGLLDATPTVLALRTLGVDPELECDLVVDAEALRRDDASLVLPAVARRAAWAGVSPPRGGWEPAGEIAAAVIRRIAEDGMADVARTVPERAGEDVVHRVRSAVWSQTDAALAGLPHGAAFAAEALGFLPDAEESAVVLTTTGWSRLSLRRGHVLVRGGAPRAGTAPQTA